MKLDCFFRGNVLIEGDLNVHVDYYGGCSDKFIGIHRYGLKQHVARLTPAKGHTLDLITTRESGVLDFPEVSAAGLCNSKGDGHRIVTCKLNVRCSSKIKEERVFRLFRDINIVDLKDDLRKSAKILMSCYEHTT